MSEIDRLIAEHCPDGVPHKPLGEVGTFVRGRRFTKADMVADGLPCIHYGEIYTTYGVSTRTTVSRVREDLRDQLRFVRTGDVIIAGVGETVGDVGKAVAWLGDGEVAIHDDSFLFRSDLDATYVSYYFQTGAFQAAKEQHVSRAKVKRLSSGGLSRITVPVPPPKVQREIVRILDEMTALKVELASEIGLRQKQSNDLARLLPNAERVRRLNRGGTRSVPLGDLAKQHVLPLAVEDDRTYTNLGVKWYGEGVFARTSKLGSAIRGSTLYEVKAGQFIYNRMFVIEGSFGVVTPDLAHGVVSNEFPVYDLDDTRISSEWLSLYFRDEYVLKRISAEVTGVERGSTKSRRRWKEKQFEAFRIELPSIEAQREVVRIVGMVGDLESALRTELEARTLQHAFYRDKLLTFKELVA